MYVCVCKAVTQAEVDGAILGGALSVADVTRVCRAGGDCGACHATIDSMIEGHCHEAGLLRARCADRATQTERRRLTIAPSRAA
jgi:bacterioferritin-associated ferredoxin